MNYITLTPISDINGVLTCELVESSRPSGGAEPEDMIFVFDYINNIVEIKNAGEEFDDTYIVQ